MKYDIEIISPVHIGTGGTLTPLDYMSTSGTLRVIDMDAFLTSDAQRADRLYLALEQDQFSLTKFLTPDEKTEDITYWKYAASISKTTHNSLNNEKDPKIAECLKTSTDYQLYLPGSSIKGGFRTAFAYMILKQNEHLLKSLKQKLLDVANDRKSYPRKKAQQAQANIEELVFCGKHSRPFYDVFKTLAFSDSSSLPADITTLQIKQSNTLSLRAPEKEKPETRQTPQSALAKAFEAAHYQVDYTPSQVLPLKKNFTTFYETLIPGIHFQGDLFFHENFFSKAAQAQLLWKTHQQQINHHTLLQAANEFAKDICQREYTFFQKKVGGKGVEPLLKFYKKLQADIEQADDHTCYLCLGQGAGWHKMTVGLLLERAKDFDFKKLRKELRLADKRLNFDYPKSRKLLMKSESEIEDKGVFGWVKIQFT